MPAQRPHPLPYASADLAVGRFEKYQVLFWPIAIFSFVTIVLLQAGVGWASAIWQLLTSGLLLVAWLLAGYGWGVIPRWLFRVRERDALVKITTLAAGLGIISLLVLGLGLAGWLNRSVAIAIMLAGVCIAMYGVLRDRASIHARVPFVHWWWLLLVPVAATTITAAMLPAGFLWGMDEPNGYDVVAYHLQVPREWFELGRIVPLHHNVFSFFPFNIEMHYLFAMHLIGGPWVAQFLSQMMHAAFVGLSIAAVYAAVADRGRLVAILAALLAASAPWMPMLGSIAYNEGGLLLYGTLAMAWAMRARNVGCASAHREADGVLKHTLHPALAISGAMAGFACGCKLTGVPMLLIGLPIALLATWVLGLLSRKQREFIPGWPARLGGLAFFIFAGLLVFSPWLIRNYVWAGNPVFPEQQNLLGRGHFSEEQSDRFYKAHKPRSDQQATSVRVAELGRQVFADWRFGYALLLIGGIVLLISLRRSESQFLLFMLIGLTAFWLLMTHLQGRFYVLAIPVAAISIGRSVDRRFFIPLVICTSLLVLSGTGFVLLHLNRLLNDNGVSMLAIGYADIDHSSFYEKEIPRAEMPVVLVGDAGAFLFHTPMSRLNYRSVFDVDASNGGSIEEAWTQGILSGTPVFLWFNFGELQRFHQTYGTPPIDSRWKHRGPGGYGEVYVVKPRSPSPPIPASAPSR